MGKKGRKTRWRTLTITDEHSDSEESNTTTSGHHVPKGYPQKSYYSRFTYSSQSTPTRRYQCDGTKSTRSSSTASENKITFNEDEYTRITTPRQDVLFKKGYLNKPKTYQTQTSTGNSTTSTGNSTGNGTPDHQSTDLEYESQFVFPNGFVDQNGIYYVNSFEPYPLMVFNPPTYYPEFSNVKAKRCSTSSLTESTSPNNEEASQDLSQNETPSNVSDFNHVYNVIYPGFYYNGGCQPLDVASQPEPRRLKKRRRRKPSRSNSVRDGTTSEYSDESSDEVFSDHQETEETRNSSDEKKEDAQKLLLNGLADKDSTEEIEPTKEKPEEEEAPKQKYDLKPDAEEFVPRAYRHHETIPMEANVQFIKIPSNFVPVPIISDFNAFIPHGIPINFIPHVNFIPNFVGKPEDAEVAKETVEEEIKETVEVPKNQIDIAKIVSKLEEAVKETGKEETKEVRKTNVSRRKKPTTSDEKEVKKTVNSPKKEATSPQTITPKPVRNYSDTLKKPQMTQPQQCERHERHMEKQKLMKATPKEIKNYVKIEATQPKATNQWISVSNRKKRKNRNVEETEDFEEIEEMNNEEITEPIQIKQEDDVEIVPNREETEPVKNEPPPPPPLPEIIEPIKEEKVKKKKTKKSQKVVTKRVIITDIDLSQEVEKKDETVPKIVVEEKPEEKRVTPEKKPKKKKKKLASSQSSSSTTLTMPDDSYDFLLESSVLNESQEKTNVEMSQELDKMIQRGIYSSLEEKIKSLNIESNDSFFKTVIHNISSRESSVENNYAIPDFGRPLPLKTKPLDFLDETTPKPPLGGVDNAEHRYPLTVKVKEWLTKTRETTPDVEVLKSPSAIFREFGGGESADEVSVCSSSREGSADPLDCWEAKANKTASSSTEEDEEVVEVYESKYGQNEDFLKIRKEAEEKKGTAFPKHGNLPYRAICCSIM